MKKVELAAENNGVWSSLGTERVSEMAAKRDPEEPGTLLDTYIKLQYIAPIPDASISFELKFNSKSWGF